MQGQQLLPSHRGVALLIAELEQQILRALQDAPIG